MMAGADAETIVKRNKPEKIALGIAFSTMKLIFFTFRYYFDRFINYLYGLYWEGDRGSIPDLKKEHSILLESATSLAKKIRNKELKSSELMKAVIERIKEVNPRVNAVTDERYKDAMADANEVDIMIEKGLAPDYFEKKPFLGVPFTCKESHAVGGMRHTLGIKARSHLKATDDAQCVRALKDAGAIPVAVTNVPEVNKWQETSNNVFGLTRNPYHRGRTVGGSSGGEAALNASLATPISLCSDIGGSTRMPAFYCGLFGHNPTAGTTSMKGSALRTGDEDNTTMASVGFISRHSQDLLPLTRIVAPGLKLDADRNIKKVNFYYVESASDLRVSPLSIDLRHAMAGAVSKLKERGYNPIPISHEGFSYMFALWKYHMSLEKDDFAAMLTDNKGRASGLRELGKWIIGASDFTFAAILKLLDDQLMPLPKAEWANAMTDRLQHDLTELLGENGVLLFPSCSMPAPYHFSAYLRPFNFAYWGVFNALRFPATQVPLGLNSEGIPLGLQVVSTPSNDSLCLAVAALFEEMYGGFVPPCRINN